VRLSWHCSFCSVGVLTAVAAAAFSDVIIEEVVQLRRMIPVHPSPTTTSSGDGTIRARGEANDTHKPEELTSIHDERFES
jgi:hypothetical protein